jgi:hypothetical protein
MTINGESQTGTIIDAEKQNRTFTILSGITFTLQNITLTNGTSVDGGAILNYGTVTINQSTLTQNTAGTGGAIYNYKGTLTINQTTLTQNTAGTGGAIYNYKGTLTINQSTLTQNTATTGGAIYNDDGTSEIHFSRIIGNNNIDVYRDGGTVNATLNWWGSNDPDFTSLLNGVNSPTNWLYMTINTTPSTINNTETSLITASFNNRYNGTTVTPYTPGVGEYIPDSTKCSPLIMS